MRMSVKIVGLMLLVSGVGAAQAGVVIRQDEANPAATALGKGVRTVMIEGHKEKMTNGDNVVILDLDGGKTLMIRPKTKSYFELSISTTGHNRHAHSQAARALSRHHDQDREE